MENLIKKLCCCDCDRQLIAQVDEQPQMLVQYSTQEDWLALGASDTIAEYLSKLGGLVKRAVGPAISIDVSDRLKIEGATWHLFNHSYEQFYSIVLNNKNEAIKIVKESEGCITSVLVDVRLVLKHCLAHNGTGIILVHNHPSGSPSPSKLDLDITEKIKKAGEIMDIRLIDHVIVTSTLGNCFSLYENGLL